MGTVEFEAEQRGRLNAMTDMAQLDVNDVRGTYGLAPADDTPPEPEEDEEEADEEET